MEKITLKDKKFENSMKNYDFRIKEELLGKVKNKILNINNGLDKIFNLKDSEKNIIKKIYKILSSLDNLEETTINIIIKFFKLWINTKKKDIQNILIKILNSKNWNLKSNELYNIYYKRKNRDNSLREKKIIEDKKVSKVNNNKSVDMKKYFIKAKEKIKKDKEIKENEIFEKEYQMEKYKDFKKKINDNYKLIKTKPVEDKLIDNIQRKGIKPINYLAKKNIEKYDGKNYLKSNSYYHIKYKASDKVEEPKKSINPEISKKIENYSKKVYNKYILELKNNKKEESLKKLDIEIKLKELEKKRKKKWKKSIKQEFLGNSDYIFDFKIDNRRNSNDKILEEIEEYNSEEVINPKKDIVINKLKNNTKPIKKVKIAKKPIKSYNSVNKYTNINNKKNKKKTIKESKIINIIEKKNIYTNKYNPKKNINVIEQKLVIKEENADVLDDIYNNLAGIKHDKINKKFDSYKFEYDQDIVKNTNKDLNLKINKNKVNKALNENKIKNNFDSFSCLYDKLDSDEDKIMDDLANKNYNMDDIFRLTSDELMKVKYINI